MSKRLSDTWWNVIHKSRCLIGSCHSSWPCLWESSFSFEVKKEGVDQSEQLQRISSPPSHPHSHNASYPTRWRCRDKLSINRSINLFRVVFTWGEWVGIWGRDTLFLHFLEAFLFKKIFQPFEWHLLFIYSVDNQPHLIENANIDRILKYKIFKETRLTKEGNSNILAILAGKGKPSRTGLFKD